MPRKLLLALVVATLLVGALFAACNSGGGGAPSATSAPPAVPTPPAAPTPTDTTPSSRTGVQDIDTVIQAVLSRDTAKLAGLVRLRPLACIGPTPSSLGALFCEGDEKEGSVVDVLPVAQCETHYTRPEELDQVLMFDPTVRLYAAYRSDDTYAAVFSQQPDSAGGLFGVTVGIDRGLISYIDYGCGQTPSQLVQTVAAGDYLIAPHETPAPTVVPTP